MDSTTLEFIKAARTTQRIELIVCAAILMVVGTFVFDVSSATERSLHELARHQQFYDQSQPCNLAPGEITAALLDARNHLFDDELPDTSNVPLPPAENIHVRVSKQPPSPSFPRIGDLMANPEAPRCEAPKYDVLVKNHILRQLAETIARGEGRIVLGPQAGDVVGNYHIDLELSYQSAGHFVAGFTVRAPDGQASDKAQADLGSSMHRSIVEWLTARKYSKLEETFDLLGRPTVYGLVADKRVNEAAETMKAVAHPEHKAVEVFGFGVPATVVGLAGPVILLGLSLLLLVYISKIRSDYSFDPHEVRTFPWFPFVAGVVPTMLTFSALLAPLVTILVVLFTLGVPSATAGGRTLEQSLTVAICIVSLVLIAVVTLSLIDSIVRMRPSTDHVVEEARRKHGARNALAMLGEQLERLRIQQDISQAELADATDIPRPLLADFERGASDLPASYLLALALELGAELKIEASPAAADD